MFSEDNFRHSDSGEDVLSGGEQSVEERRLRAQVCLQGLQEREATGELLLVAFT